MNRIVFFFILGITLAGDFFWEEKACISLLEGYHRPENVPLDAWESVQPYLLPEKSPAFHPLNKLFGSKRITANKASLREAGFNLTEDQGLHVVVASHTKLKGYLIKVILDKYDPNAKGGERDWEHWLKRIEGERVIRQAIAELGYKKYFKVPRQWIYPLPSGPKCPVRDNYIPKSFILIVEDMRLEPKQTNSQFYRHIGKKWLNAIYIITTKYGLSDCCNKHNLPLSRDGKLAFVDTETFYNWPINYHRMLEFLSTGGKSYWNALRRQNGP